MYESEVNGIIESVNQLAPEILARFAELASRVSSRTVLPWGEHCHECVFPTCYSTCGLYDPRPDLKCRRFVNGMVRLPYPEGINSYLLKISFKKWAKLWSMGNFYLHPVDSAQTLEMRDERIATLLRRLPVPSPLKRQLIYKRYNSKKKWAARLGASKLSPDAFLVECHNPNLTAVGMTVTMRKFDHDPMPFQRLIKLKPGYNLVRLPLRDFSAALGDAPPFDIELTPNEFEEGMTLYFGLMEFVTEKVIEPAVAVQAEKVKTVKCLVWDLDNTLWEGILIEDGAEKLRLREGIVEVIEELDRRGILHSVASKNNSEDALQVLKKFGLDQYFLYPQISWGAKSEGVKNIAANLNIGLDSLAFIDDSKFELAEVEASCPQVRLVDAADYLSLPGFPECQVPVTEESRNRRAMYRAEEVRQATAATFGGDYLSFLRSSNITLKISPLAPANLERVHELAQRTNQMNFSGNRYEEGILKEVLETDYLDTFVMSCEDIFGSYGIIGFSIVDRREPRMVDLMFSCRVQSKRVEHAFLAYVLKRYLAAGGEFRVNYRKTPKNTPAGRVFDDLGLEVECEKEGVTSLLFRGEKEIPDDGIVRIVVDDAAAGKGGA